MMFLLVCIVLSVAMLFSLIIESYFTSLFQERTKRGPRQFEESNAFGNGILKQRSFRCIEEKPKTFASTGDIVNNFNFLYPLNNKNACSKGNVDILIPVHSAASSFKRRYFIRRILKRQLVYNRKGNIKLLFFVGLSALDSSTDTLERLHVESKTFGDIIHVYENNTQTMTGGKAISVLHWISSYCNTSEFVLKIDEDVLINISPLVISLYKTRYKHQEFVIGALRSNITPARSPKVKWYMSRQEYPNSTYPPFVVSTAMGFPTSTALLLYRQALRTQLIHLNDVFITGICSKKLGIPVLNSPNYVFTHRYRLNKLVFFK